MTSEEPAAMLGSGLRRFSAGGLSASVGDVPALAPAAGGVPWPSWAAPSAGVDVPDG